MRAKHLGFLSLQSPAAGIRLASLRCRSFSAPLFRSSLLSSSLLSLSPAFSSTPFSSLYRSLFASLPPPTLQLSCFTICLLRRSVCFVREAQINLGGGMLDINLFREDKGNDPERIRESQRRRGASVEIIDEVIRLDKEWRQRQFELDCLRKDFNRFTELEVEEVCSWVKAKKDASEKIKSTEENKRLATEKTEEVLQAKATLEAKLMIIGNLVHDSVPISMDEADNQVVRTWGERRMEGKLRSHVELVEKLGIADLKKDYNNEDCGLGRETKGRTRGKLGSLSEIFEAISFRKEANLPLFLDLIEMAYDYAEMEAILGATVAGGRGYYLKGDGVLLNIALINFGLVFLRKKNYEPLQTPFFMRKDIMAKCAQLAQFDEELYKVTGEGEDKYLIATSEQPLCSYHLEERIYPTSLPLRYAGYSTCFRKEAGSHGRDTLGIFRVHQFEKVEQFCITSPNDNESWLMLEEMLKNSEEFYQELKIPYQIVAIVSGALNDAAAKKYDLEGWFPASKTYRELVSCSNCTDYQARRLGIGYGQKKVSFF
ncbi:Serine--tRNA ligase [Dendrobium catenatum]|uniref:serine--tRNA ligase n=1 Tax=Dendrobium catenatum TaxID=906689 RepID=A0A2I0VH14_9ASPA|nr:Serine--tRNA ligase [Dendrobium catenatum]